MLSLPDDWDYSLNGLCAICKESEGAIKSTLRELKDNGYLNIEKIRGDKGYFEYNYIIYEHPYNLEKFKENPEGQNPPVDTPKVENQTQINTNIIKSKKQIDKDDKTISSFFVAEEHNILTLELIKRGYINETDTQIFYYDKLFEDLLDNDNSYKDLLCVIHYIVPRVVKRNFEDEEGKSNK